MGSDLLRNKEVLQFLSKNIKTTSEILKQCSKRQIATAVYQKACKKTWKV